MIEEIWKPIKDYEGIYEVSNIGNIRSCKRYVKNKHGVRIVKEKMLKSSIDYTGYQKVALCNKCNQKTFLVHRLVAETFLGVKGKGLKGKELLVNHKDQNKLNNKLNNLEWVDQTENMKQARDNIYNKKIFNIKRVRCIGDENKVFDSIKQASEYFGVKYHIIINCLTGKTIKACNHKWKYEQ